MNDRRPRENGNLLVLFHSTYAQGVGVFAPPICTGSGVVPSLGILLAAWRLGQKGWDPTTSRHLLQRSLSASVVVTGFWKSELFNDGNDVVLIVQQW